nr:MAG TPA: hypothetical protein [Caudoviricetes sp.]
MKIKHITRNDLKHFASLGCEIYSCGYCKLQGLIKDAYNFMPIKKKRGGGAWYE